MPHNAPPQAEHAPSPLPNPDSCARCAQRFPTCCRIAVEREECCFPLSEAERKAILAHAGSDCSIVRQANTPLFVRGMQDLFPDEHNLLAAAFPQGGEHWRFALAPGGACVFLQKDGCMLPRTARPAYCRIFPFWIRRDEIWHFSLRECQAQREQRGRIALQQYFGLSDMDVWTLYALLRQGWGLPPRPARRSFWGLIGKSSTLS